MNVTLTPTVVKKMKGKGIPEVDEAFRYSAGDEVEALTINIIDLSSDVLKRLAKALEGNKAERRSAIALKTIDVWHRAQTNPGDIVVKRLDQLEGVLKKYLQKSKDFRVYRQHDDDTDVWLPYVVTEISYHEADASEKQPARVEINFAYFRADRVQSTSSTVYQKDLVGGRNPAQVFEQEGGYVMQDDRRKKMSEQHVKRDK